MRKYQANEFFVILSAHSILCCKNNYFTAVSAESLGIFEIFFYRNVY